MLITEEKETAMTSSEIGIVHGFSGFAVPDLMAAKKFYGETLGLDVTENEMGLLSLRLPGGAELIICGLSTSLPRGGRPHYCWGSVAASATTGGAAAVARGA